MYGILYGYTAVLNVSSPTHNIIPIFIKSWNITPANWQQVWRNQTVNVTIVFRNDSGWSNGQPITAWDYYATSLWLDMFSSPPYANITVINNYTVVISNPPGTFSPLPPSFSLMNVLGIGNVALIIPYNSGWKPVIEQIAGNFSVIQKGGPEANALRTHFINLIKSYRLDASNYPYSGPFYITQITPSAFVMSKNPYYFAASRIPFSQVVLYQAGSPQVAAQNIISGKVSMDWGGLVTLPPAYFSQLPPYMKLLVVNAPFDKGLYFNFKNPWLKLVQVRQAIAYVLNRTALAIVGGNIYSPIPIPNEIPDFPYLSQLRNSSTYLNSLNPYPTNTTKAAQLLTSAGFTFKNGLWYTPNGTQFSLVIGVSGTPSPDQQAILQAIQSELANFGITTSLTIFPNINAVHNAWQTGQGYDLFWLDAWGGSVSIYGTFDWGLPLSYFGGYPWNVSQWNLNITLPNGTVVDLHHLFLETRSPASLQQMIQANQEISYYMNQYMAPSISLVEQGIEVIINTQQVSVPSNDSWVWTQALYGIANTGLIQTLLLEGMISPATSTSTSTTSTTQMPSTVTTTTTTTATSVTTTTATTTSISTTTSATTVTTTAVSTSVSSVTSVLTSILTSVSSSGLSVPIVAAIVVVIAVVVGLIVYFLARRR